MGNSKDKLIYQNKMVKEEGKEKLKKIIILNISHA